MWLRFGFFLRLIYQLKRSEELHVLLGVGNEQILKDVLFVCLFVYVFLFRLQGKCFAFSSTCILKRVWLCAFEHIFNIKVNKNALCAKNRKTKNSWIRTSNSMTHLNGYLFRLHANSECALQLLSSVVLSLGDVCVSKVKGT